jgi:uncharacterized DUF497 family protein
MFEWDKHKDRQNLEKHGIAFADTFAVFEDPNALTIGDDEREEERFVTTGLDCFGRIRSARKATKSEVKQYESKL